MDLLEYDPASGYTQVYKESFAAEAESFFDAAVEQGRIDPAANAAAAAQLRRLNKKKERCSGKKGLLIWLIVLMIAVPVIGVICILSNVPDGERAPYWWGMMIVVCIVLSIIIFKLYPIVRELGRREAELENAIKAKYREIMAQLAPLYKFFTWSTMTDLFSKVIPPVVFDDFLSNERLKDLRENFGLLIKDACDTTLTGSYSGTFYGYPFVFTEDVVYSQSEKVWTGSKTITYRERITGSDGKSTWVTRTQILTASVIKPCPAYSRRRNFFFGHDTAPHLSFSRTPSSLSGGEGLWHTLSKKYQMRELHKFEQNLKDESLYTMVSNHDFEVLFRSENRDNEIEFRVLYTPLAQQYMVKLLNDKEAGFGDDFSYTKQGRITRICSEHLNQTSLTDPPFNSDKFDLTEIKKLFLEISSEFFRSLYFSFAPVFLVPAYNEPRLDTPPCSEARTISPSEIEGAASFHGALFANGKSITENIFNVSGYAVCDGVIHAEIEALGFAGIDRVDYVPCYGNDGRLHNVPVPWVEYIPVSRHTPVKVWRAEELPPGVKPLFIRRGVAFTAG